ncbi:ParA family protein [Chitinibacter bivalviorum]|uniref:ParA family protein n=1 Tax=Chitinibacter bivalviorum TaxID=2739434 RepID=A0A7H9BMD5_9NEIS|nr:ParA family protein [Chitinibacter bivalviorum]QLG89629.1 ParA family protein [Chitinibacter bivalviorum]
MRKILIANPKGGSGKSTLSTHLASWFAWQEANVMLGDLDKQHSSHHWLNLRSEQLPQIARWDIGDDQIARPPKGCQVAVLDTPACFSGSKLKKVLKIVDHVIVPILPSAFDLWASADFFEELAEMKAIRREEVQVGVVGMRVNSRTQTAQQLPEFLKKFDIPLITCIRDTQLYNQTIQRGMTLFDLPQSKTQRDRDEWKPLIEWALKRQ